MLSSITWGQYFSAVALLLLLYYGYVAFLFYKWEILGLMGVKKIGGTSLAATTLKEFKSSLEVTPPEDNIPTFSQTSAITPLVQPFTDELKAYLLEAVPWIEKQDLMQDLKLITSKYPALKTTDYLSEASAITLFEVNNTFPDIIQPGDVEILWE